MATVEAYLYSNCTSCKKAEALLKEAGVEAAKRDLFKERLSASEIREMLSRANLSLEEVLSTRSRPYGDLKLAEQRPGDEELINLMAEYPALLKRPIVVKDGSAVVGFKRDAILQLVAK